QEQVSTPEDRRFDGSIGRSVWIQQDRSEIGISPDKGESRGYTEDCIQDEVWSL
ncbi:hypothetical protein A2U01_0101969, partial [Trifolium medium]|nr:hypothetical protein [Trifolium medium]